MHQKEREELSREIENQSSNKQTKNNKEVYIGYETQMVHKHRSTQPYLF